MATSTNLFSDKETTNWFKACIALNITKEGLTDFLKTELQKVNAAIGTSCGNCSIEQLIPCPTHKYCNKKGNYCFFHKSQKPQQCQTCDKVKQKITLQHRYGGPSWRNTHAENWIRDYWEIGKCYLPPDGYISVSSVQESDFNGVISIMLNCLHFQTCLSSPCLSPPPPDEQCPLEKVRQIGRDVRHTSDCKVADADLQDYFQALIRLLTDPKCLQHDPSATIACTRLSDLQHDRMSIKELGDLLNEAYKTLKHAQEAGERFSEEAERTLAKTLDAATMFGEQCLIKETQVGKRRLKSEIHAGQQRLKRKTKVGEQRLDSKAHIGEERIESKTILGKGFIDRKTQLGEQRIESKIHYAEQCLESKIQDGTNRIENSAQNVILRMKQIADETSQADYERGVADFRRRLKEHYHDSSSNVSLSILNQSLDKRLTDIFATPKIHRIEIAKDGQRLYKEQVMTYKEIFYSEYNYKRRIYVQGEPGSGKSTFAAKLVNDWSDGNHPSSKDTNENAAFDDVLIIRNFKFVFFISMRDTRGQTDVRHMIKKQLIDTMYSEQKRDVVYKLLHQIIETEVCLVVRDGLDEWVAPDGSSLAEPSMAGFPNDKCTVLTTSRPWKLADERFKNSLINVLLEITGINDPYKFSERILRCILDESKDRKKTAKEILTFILERGLKSLLYSPMLYTLIICTWVDTIEQEEGRLKKLSMCAFWTTMLESLCKKANDTTGFFNDLNPPQVKCFSSTSYLQPSIEHLDVISKAAFYLLFSAERETSIVFNDQILSNYVSKIEKDFALKAGLISQRKTKRDSNAPISFIHNGMQEFLAAYHIARNSHLIDDIISRYLTRHKDAYLYVSQVFIFLCGMNISAANKLSGMINEHNDIMMKDDCFCCSSSSFQHIIAEGYKEAVLNEYTGILLRLSHFKFIDENFWDLYKIWNDNTSNALVLDVRLGKKRGTPRSPEHSESTSHVEFDLSTCHKLKLLTLIGHSIRLKDSAKSVSSALPVCIVLNYANPAQCADPQVLPSIEHIRLQYVTCSSTWLRSLFSTLLALGHEVDCHLTECNITSCVEDKVRGSDSKTIAKLKCLKNTSNMLDIDQGSPGLWEALFGLNVKSLSLLALNMNHTEPLSQALSSLTHLEKMSVTMCDDSPGLLKGLYGLNIKSLSVRSLIGFLNANNAKTLSQSLPSLTHLETLSIEGIDDSTGLLKALNCLNVKSLSLTGRFGLSNVNDVKSLSQALLSLKQLETLIIVVWDESPGLYTGLRGLNIKSLSLCGWFEWMNVIDVKLLSQSLSLLTHLETLSIEVCDDSPGLLKALRGLNVKSLRLKDGQLRPVYVNHVECFSKLLSSLKALETLSICARTYIDIQLPQSLKYLNIHCLALHPSQLREYVNTLSTCTQTVECTLEFGCASFDDYRFLLGEYICIQQELETLKNVVVERFRFFDRIKPYCFYYRAPCSWSVRDIGGGDDDNQDDDNVKDEAYQFFESSESQTINNRISIRLLIHPTSN